MAEEFIGRLYEFHHSKGEAFEVPKIDSKEVDLYHLYKEVVSRGGFQQVSNNKLWKEVVTALQHPSQHTTGVIRNLYYKVLYPYEQTHFFQRSTDDFAPAKNEFTTATGNKKVRLTKEMLFNNRRMILAFDSRAFEEVNFAVNTLLLFSCNTSQNYHIENNGVMESMLGYLNFCTENIEIEEEDSSKHLKDGFVCENKLLEQMKSILLVIRNLSMIRNNQITLYRVQGLVDTVVTIFNSLLDKETIENCLEILVNLGKHIFLRDLENHKELLCTLIDCLQSEFAEKALECLRKLSLPIGNEEVLELLPQEFFNQLSKWLLHYSSAKDSVLEILSNLSDQGLDTKVKIGKAPGCISGLVSLLSSSSQTEETEDKQAKMAAIILSNLAQSPKNCKLLEPFQAQIFMVATVDERISGFLANVLYEVQDTSEFQDLC